VMIRFVYTAYDKTGSKHEDHLLAIDMESAKIKLKELGLIPVKIDKSDDERSRIKSLYPFNSKPKLSDIEFMTSQLSLLMRNGVKIDRALRIAKSGIKNVTLNKIVEKIYGEIRRGTPLSVCLEKYPDVFDTLYVSLVKIGETTGRFSHVFENLAANLNFRQKIMADTRQAMIYPLIISGVCTLSIFFIFNFILPKISVIFAGMDSLPIYTEFLLRISKLVQKYQYMALLAVPAIVVLQSRFQKNKFLKRFSDGLVLKIPVTRGLVYNLENLRFASALSVLLKSGVVLNQALDLAVKSVGNLYIKKRLLIVKKEIREGKRLSEAIFKTEFFPLQFNGLIEAGEETGSLADVFSETEQRLKTQYEFLDPVPACLHTNHQIDRRVQAYGFPVLPLSSC